MTQTQQTGSKSRKPSGYRPLLTVANAKTIKGEKLGYLTGILYLAPADEAGRGNLCPMATTGCRRDCLFTAGRAQYLPSIVTSRIAKTNFLYDNREAFLNSLRYDIQRVVRRAAKLGYTPAIRINGTSDQPWMAMQMASEFPDVQFYDYTKIPRPWQRTRSNYHVTFSHSESNSADCQAALDNGINVAVVFAVKRGRPLPETWNGHVVIDGDQHDLRFLDQQGVVVGLRAKGRARNDETTGFVVSIAAAKSAAA